MKTFLGSNYDKSKYLWDTFPEYYQMPHKPVCDDGEMKGEIVVSVPGEEYWKKVKVQLYNSRINFSGLRFHRPDKKFL